MIQIRTNVKTLDEVRHALQQIDSYLQRNLPDLQDDITITGDWTFTGTVTHSGNILMGTDEIQFYDSDVKIASADDGHLDLTADTGIDMNGTVYMTKNCIWGTSWGAIFRDAEIYIASNNDGHLDLVADISIDLNATTVLGTNSLQFYDSAVTIASADDGHLDLTADISIDVNGLLDMSTNKIQFWDSDVYMYSSGNSSVTVAADGSIYLTSPYTQVSTLLGVNITPGADALDVDGSGHIRTFLYLNSERDSSLLSGNLRIESDSESEPVTDFLYDVSANSYGRTRKFQASGYTSGAAAVQLWLYPARAEDPSIQSIAIRAHVVWVDTDDDTVGTETVYGHYKYVGSGPTLTLVAGSESEIHRSTEDANQTVYLATAASSIALMVQSSGGDDCVWYGYIEITEIVMKAEGGGGGC